MEPTKAQQEKKKMSNGMSFESTEKTLSKKKYFTLEQPIIFHEKY